METWVKINCIGGYSVSNMGRVKNDTNNKIRKGVIIKSGYETVLIRPKLYYVHRLVALAFIENNNDTMNQVNHKDGIKTNNTVENLEWTDNSGNQKHARVLGLNKGYDKHGKNNPRFIDGKFTRVDINKNCLVCNAVFVAKHAHLIVCSFSCRTRLNNRRRAKAKEEMRINNYQG